MAGSLAQGILCLCLRNSLSLSQKHFLSAAMSYLSFVLANHRITNTLAFATACSSPTLTKAKASSKLGSA